MTQDLNGATALVTGATAGIGRATAIELAGLGATAIVHGRNAERGDEVVHEITSHGGQAAQAGDVGVLVNNAGVYQFGSTEDVDDDTFDLHINTNLRAPFLLVKHLAPAMTTRGGGSIVNVSTLRRLGRGQRRRHLRRVEGRAGVDDPGVG
jgi:NAD(P)-dependent dehydrogenase (short-subunit alcohol dehydrogenase family)